MHDKTRFVQERSLCEYLSDDPATQLLVVGRLPKPLLDSAAAGVSIHRLDTLAAAEKKVTLPPVADVGEQPAEHVARALVLELDPSDNQFEQQLGRAIRAFPHRVLLHCTSTDASPGRRDEDFFAFGFRRILVVQDADNPGVKIRWFEYSLSQYKPAPDWLNAQFWANPDRFDIDDYYDEDEDEDEDE